MFLLSAREMDLLILFAILLLLLTSITFYKNYMGKKRAAILLELLVGIIEADNPNLGGHSLYVHNLTMLIYEFLPYPRKLFLSETDLHYASLLLDIGKFGIPYDIMEKSGKLGDKEWEIVKKHPDIGVEMLGKLPGLRNALTYILYHHERMDGNGYHQLKGSQIPLGARIIAVADTYSAITMNRSYKASLSYPEAIAELRMAAGSQLDEEIVDRFCNIPKSRLEACMEDALKKIELSSEHRKGN
ncbi:HD-GYP domain-containing protein [Butyrivibrio sp. AC2005]|uniref:HD-GYP domain-containing protein n=1 Tax=Butyrivibrio sp. AC2005 TaxID=1280672 RepID=UPI0004005FEB|nr:HD domain-containing phosphohydrolase [Butyrivibrio sp. AC2005]